MTTLKSGLFGLRLAPGLHLGHLVGNVRPAVADQERLDQTVVILADLFTYTSQRDADVTRENTESLVAECMALGLTSPRVKYVVQSQAFAGLLPLCSLLSCLLRFDKLRNTRPLPKLLESEDVSFGEIFFPVLQCAEMIATRSSVLYSNVDNLGLVSLAKYLCGRVANRTGADIPEPRLVTGETERVLGLDYMSMSNGRGNAIFLGDAPSTVEKKIVRIRTDLRADTDLDLSLVWEYLRVVQSSETELREWAEQISDNTMTALELKAVLVERMVEQFGVVSERKAHYLRDRDALANRVRSDTSEVRAQVDENVAQIWNGIHDPGFLAAFY